MKEQGKPLIVDSKMRRLWALVDSKDGTLYAGGVSADFSPPNGERGAGKHSHWEISLFTTLDTAERAAAFERQQGVKLEPVEVIVVRKDAAR